MATTDIYHASTRELLSDNVFSESLRDGQCPRVGRARLHQKGGLHVSLVTLHESRVDRTMFLRVFVLTSSITETLHFLLCLCTGSVDPSDSVSWFSHLVNQGPKIHHRSTTNSASDSLSSISLRGKSDAESFYHPPRLSPLSSVLPSQTTYVCLLAVSAR